MPIIGVRFTAPPDSRTAPLKQFLATAESQDQGVNGDSFREVFNATPIDVYPKPMFAIDDAGNSPNNFVLLSAVHSLRINRLLPYQKNNKFIFYGWNRYMPLYKDPIVPWNYQLTDPRGELIDLVGPR